MAGESYYFVFSIVTVLVAALHIANMVYFRTKSRTILGEDVKPGALGHEKFKKLSSVRGLVAAALLALILVANLAYAVSRVMELDNPEYAHGMLIYAPIVIILFFVVMLLVMRNKLRSDKRG